MSYCEFPEHYEEVRRKARKQHKCCETGRVIEKGEYYWACTSIWDGNVRTFKQSEAAYHFARHLNKIGTPHAGEDCIPFTMIGDHMNEHHKPISDDEPPDPLWIEWQKVKAGEITRTT